MPFPNRRMQSRKTLRRIVTSRHPPDSYHSLASPSSKIGGFATCSKTLLSQSTFPDVVKSAPRAVQLRTRLRRNTTDGCQSAFSTASPTPIPCGTSMHIVSTTRSVPSICAARTLTVCSTFSSVSALMTRSVSPALNTSKPTDATWR